MKDVFARIDQLIVKPPTPETQSACQEVFSHLSQRWPEEKVPAVERSANP